MRCAYVRVERVLLIIFLAWAIFMTGLFVYYFQELTFIRKRYADVLSAYNATLEAYKRLVEKLNKTISEYERMILRVNILINYGNGTLRWHNATRVLAGSTAFEALEKVARVNSTTGAYGVFITGIDGISQNSTCFWVFAVYKRCEAEWGMSTKVGDWCFPGVSADQVVLKDGDTLAFLFYNYAKKGWPPPKPTAS